MSKDVKECQKNQQMSKDVKRSHLFYCITVIIS